MGNIVLYKNIMGNSVYYSYKYPETEGATEEAYRIPGGWEIQENEIGDIFIAPDRIERLFDEVFFVDDDGRPGLAYDKDDGEVMEYMLEEL